MKRNCLLLITSILYLSLFSCTQTRETQTESAEPTYLNKRIITLGGVITETVSALGFQNEIVGVDRTSTFPQEVKELPNLGFGNAIAIESIIDLNPDIVLALESAVSENLIRQLRESGIRHEIYRQEFSKDGSIKLFRDLGLHLDASLRSDSLVQTFEASMPEVVQQTDKKLLFVYARGQGAMQVAGQDTPANALIQMLGYKNAVTAFEGFRPLTPEALVEADPYALLFFESGLESLGGKDGLAAIPGLKETQAGRDARVVALDGLKMIGFGPRLPEAIKEIQAQL
ncbi:MAG: ABC transporter substrate-binding protein [Cyclobacteriaceae bacterium]|nr:ABC transporter substrate-binding protein [Cyclobacteriaceae bacterium]MCH8515896.1 ABC transporter substrate-binding protein [Cyclobacteriaceae bacterium]